MSDHGDLETQLTDLLDTNASTVHAAPDTTDLLERVRRRARRRQQLLGGALAVALATGPLVGYRIGDAIGHDEQASVASEGDPASDVAATPITDQDMASGPATTVVGDGAGGFSADRAMSSYGHGYGVPMEPVGVVTVGDMTIRLFRVDHGTPDDGNPTWDPPAGCYSTGLVIGEASTGAMVATLAGDTFGLTPTEGVVQPVGVGEGDPHWLAVGTTDATAVTVRFADGQSVDAAVVDGVFAAAAPAPGVGDDPLVGDTTATVIAGGAETPIRSWSGPVDEEFYRQCEPPPPALPPAGEQPADPDAARTQIVEAYQRGYQGGEGQVDAFADPAAIAPVLEQLDTSETFDQYRGQIEAVVGEIVFDSPTHAFLFYDLEPILSGRIGEAVLTDRGWKVANATICADVSMAGVRCG
ncbi:hypothetical protein [Actinospongicola halichondriae]|uniref:hypothetical protein n=1 Tax=Actinospongicola halichondriae TaxID=3236844 RepID=UPI003D53689F